MPERVITVTKYIYSDVTSLATYLTSAYVGTMFTDWGLQFLGTLLSLLLSTLIVYYFKKWLEKEDNKLNKKGGLFNFIVVYLKTRYKDKCQDKCK